MRRMVYSAIVSAAVIGMLMAAVSPLVWNTRQSLATLLTVICTGVGTWALCRMLLRGAPPRVRSGRVIDRVYIPGYRKVHKQVPGLPGTAGSPAIPSVPSGIRWMEPEWRLCLRTDAGRVGWVTVSQADYEHYREDSYYPGATPPNRL